MTRVTYCLSPNRLFPEVLNRWWLEPGADVRVLCCKTPEMQWKRRKVGEWTSGGYPYVVADDDCMPPFDPFLQNALDILAAYPEFGILSLLPFNEKINPWAPLDYAMYEDDRVMEHHSVGQIRVCRPGIIEAWPEMLGQGYDREHCQAIRDAGYKVGYYREIHMEHLGKGNSTVWITGE